MSPLVRQLPFILGAIAIALLGYAFYTERQRSADLELELGFAQMQMDSMRESSVERQGILTRFLLSDEVQGEISQIAELSNPAARQARIAKLNYDLSVDMVEGGAAPWEVSQFVELVRETSDEERVLIADDLIASASPITEQPVVGIAPETIATVSTLVALLGSIGTALSSAFLFVTGGAKRRIEQEMLSVDLEKQRVELATMRFEARDAIAATKST